MYHFIGPKKEWMYHNRESKLAEHLCSKPAKNLHRDFLDFDFWVGDRQALILLYGLDIHSDGYLLFLLHSDEVPDLAKKGRNCQ